MVFIVTGVASNEAVSFSFDAAETALERARIAARFDVLVTEGDGLQYAPSVFERVFPADEPAL